MAPFLQSPPILADAWKGDALLRSVVEAQLPPEVFAAALPLLEEAGSLCASKGIIELGLQAEREPPRLVPYSTWGERRDAIEVSPAYQELGRVGVKLGVTALPYESDPYGAHARIVWAAVLTMWGPSSALYSCPVAMTDAAARTLMLHGAPGESSTVARLTSRDPATAWTSGQWMTEMTGGSDVGGTETVARRGEDGVWRLYGTKWFTSATTSEMALTLARPEGAPPGSKGLALFKILRTSPDGAPNAIRVRRLKDKLGTRAMPTAELSLEGAVADPIGDMMDGGGLRRISTMLNITRLHNAIGAAGSLARGLAWASAFADVREVFGRKLRDQPAHKTTLLEMATDEAAALVLVFRCAELTGKAEHGLADERELAILRGLTPVAKLATARWAVRGAAEAMEALGGVGYCEDSGLPALVRNAHVLPIWEGTTNVLALDLLRAEQRSGSLTALLEEAAALITPAQGTALSGPAQAVTAAARELGGLLGAAAHDSESSQAIARPLAMGLARTYACARLVHLASAGHPSLAGAARRLAGRGLVPSVDGLMFSPPGSDAAVAGVSRDERMTTEDVPT
jgi:alkylation response protein AidB-like acyl-CoA dehydrogenase